MIGMKIPLSPKAAVRRGVTLACIGTTAVFSSSVLGADQAGSLAIVAFSPVFQIMFFGGSVVLLLGAGVVLYVDRARPGAAADGADLSARLRERVEAVNAAFGEAAALMEDLRRDLAAQQAARQALVAETEQQRRLLAVDREQAERVRELLIEANLLERRRNRREQLLFFILGVIVSIPAGILVNLISSN
jgi:hypothetical protein